jgi:hypothetical protein
VLAVAAQTLPAAPGGAIPHLCHIALSLPITKQSMRFGPQETAAGAEVQNPPRLSQPRQAEPSHHLCHIALSLPITKQSSRFAAHEETATPCLQ